MAAKNIKLFDNNKSCGLDGIHPRQLRELVDHVSGPIGKILHQSIKDEKHEKLPTDWKTATVSSIFKKGDKNVAANYRPISLASIIWKLIESFIKEAIISHLANENLISNKQFGFINGRSTTSQLLHFVEKCANTMAGLRIRKSIRHYTVSKAKEKTQQMVSTVKLANGLMTF